MVVVMVSVGERKEEWRKRKTGGGGAGAWQIGLSYVSRLYCIPDPTYFCDFDSFLDCSHTAAAAAAQSKFECGRRVSPSIPTATQKIPNSA